jgi:hypothetical protein
MPNDKTVDLMGYLKRMTGIDCYFLFNAQKSQPTKKERYFTTTAKQLRNETTLMNTSPQSPMSVVLENFPGVIVSMDEF